MPCLAIAQFAPSKQPVKIESKTTNTLQAKTTASPSQGTIVKPLTPTFTATAEQQKSYTWYRMINPTNVVVAINPANASSMADASIQAYVGRREMNLTGWINQNIDLGIAASCDSLVHLRALPSLEYVRLRSYPSDLCFQQLAGMRSIRYLQYAGASSNPENLMITDASMQIIGGFTNLEVLDIFSCNRVTDAGLARLSGLVNLRELNLNHWTGLSPACLSYLANMKKLETLRVVGMNLTDASLQQLENLPMLNFFNATRANGLTDQAADVLLSILPRMPNLKRINLQFTGVGDAAKQRIRDAYPTVSVW
jgi:Leucine-rich repeat (LRR) protein